METTNNNGFTKVLVTFNRKDYEFFIKDEDVRNNEEWNADDRHGFKFYSVLMYRENGERVIGLWKHGRTGQKLHEHPIVYNTKDNEIEEVREYHSGCLRNREKYLVKIL